ncbi:hypothetical protein [Variovorax ginsengisoli]|uniref:Uncharacterized protein n=1 Tax=Variovorax ginsengisoli TaxID=363844 RepID=A0ABT9S510_9BURK|nr:hypothetical protein [Variovorax ginsengisoli]MDP9899444.1 hypothetical protein [Variovorax ginsengisoli]
MPNLTLFIAAQKMPPARTRDALTTQCAALCIEILQAAPENVHIVYVCVDEGRGHPAFAELKYRLEPFRTQGVMASFMERLDETIRNCTALTARIRCFGYAASTIHALH